MNFSIKNHWKNLVKYLKNLLGELNISDVKEGVFFKLKPFDELANLGYGNYWFFEDFKSFIRDNKANLFCTF